MPAIQGLRDQGLQWPQFRIQLPLSSPDALPGDSFSLDPDWLGSSTLSLSSSHEARNPLGQCWRRPSSWRALHIVE